MMCAPDSRRGQQGTVHSLTRSGEALLVEAVICLLAHRRKRRMETPISMLQDFCSRHFDGKVPEYQLLSSECQVHKPTFVYRVEIGNVVATAPGQSKKKAKHAAARAALQSLLLHTDDPMASMYLSSAIETGEGGDEKQENMLTDAEMNSVGKLQELCMKKRWRPPNYDTHEEFGAPHERMFRMICEVNCDGKILRSEGSGRSKKLAKRCAAIRMIAELESQNYLPTGPMAAVPTAAAPRLETGKTADDSVMPDLSLGKQANAYDKVVEFWNGVGDDLNCELDPLLDTDDPCESLTTVSDFLECHVDYQTLPSRCSDVCNIMVHLQPIDKFQTPIPIVSGWGMGQTDGEARIKAAHRLLQNLKTVRYIK